MDYSKIFAQQNEVLRNALPKLITIPWLDFGTKYRLHDEAGNLKYQAMMRGCYPSKSGEEPLKDRFGQLANEEDSFVVLGNKLDVLEDYPYAITSMRLRNPPKVWSGAIRTNLGITGLTGLTEIGDHLAEVYLSLYTQMLSFEDCLRMIDTDQQGAYEAMEAAGMSTQNWRGLSSMISHIVLEASV